jgi:hypothetical protein
MINFYIGKPNNQINAESLDAAFIGLPIIFEMIQSPDLFGEKKTYRITGVESSDELRQEFFKTFPEVDRIVHDVIVVFDKILALEKKKLDRILLRQEDSEKLEGWLTTTEQQIPGIRINRSQLVHWLISQKDEVLSGSEIDEIRDLFFDELSHLKWIVREMTKASQRGETPKIGQFFKPVTKRKNKREDECTPFKPAENGPQSV